MTTQLAGGRGVLHPGPSGQAFTLTRHPAPPGLAHLVDYLWVVEWDLPDGERYVSQVLSHPTVNLCVMAGRSRISGVTTTVFTQPLEGAGRVVGVRYRPGAFRLLIDGSVRRLTDAELPITAVYDVDVAALERAVLLPVPVQEAVAVLAALLRTRVPDPDITAELVADVVEAVVADRSITRVEQVADRFGVPVWRLQRLFSDSVGVSPKWVLMRARVHDATDSVAGGGVPDWAALAAELGYCDQAHLIRAFKAAVGLTPAEYARRSIAG